MNAYALKTLEYDKVLAILADRTQSELGRCRVQALTPLLDLKEINIRLGETTELKKLLEPNRALSLSGICDLTSIFKKKGDWQDTFSSREMQAIASIVHAAGSTKKILQEDLELTYMMGLAEQLSTFPEIEDAVDRTLNPDGTIKDSASGKLKSTRKKIQHLKKRIRDKIISFGKSSGLELYLQDSNVRENGDRPTVAVIAKYASKVNGVKRGRSDSGKTVFIEPEAVKSLGDDLELEQYEENLEQQRLLGEITELILQRREDLLSTVEILAHLDMTYAKVRLSRELHMNAPIMNSEGFINLKGATHPLLQVISKEKKEEESVIPIDVPLGQDFTTLIVTGPNTGGKTITLKTIGLLSLMAQSGMHIPASQESKISVFENIWADIGDEQSIEQSLSTFSSHLKGINEILNTADHRSLVLLDELGGGTDPSDGAALAKAILSYLHQKKVRVAVSTHISQLKTLGYTVEGMENASIEFNTETLQPTYRVLLGLPGESNALSLARRLGLPEKVLRQAASFSEDDETTQLIQQLQTARNEVSKDQTAAAEVLLKHQTLKAELDKKLTEVNTQLEEAKEQNGEKAFDFLRSLKTQIDTILNEKNSKRSLICSFEMIQNCIEDELRMNSSHTATERQLQVGDRVQVIPLKQIGNVIEVKVDKTLVIALGSLTMTLPICDVKPVEG